MTAKKRVQAKPPEVQEVLKAWMVKNTLEMKEPIDWEAQSKLALEWWHDIHGAALAAVPDEATFARMVITEARKDSFWGKIWANQLLAIPFG